MLLAAVSVLVLLLAPSIGLAQDFTLTDVGCSNAPFAAAISSPGSASAGLPFVLEYSVTGVLLKPTGDVCGTCTQKEQYCARTEQYSCNCGTSTYTCNCKTQNYDCNCKTQNYDCNCKTTCAKSETYVCGRSPYTCCHTEKYTCYWIFTCSKQVCGTCYSPNYCSRCAQWSTSCQTCQKTTCDTCQKTTCDKCTSYRCDTCERCAQTAWRDITTPCKWSWTWDFTAQAGINGEVSNLVDKGSVCLAIASGQCAVRANFTASEEVALSPGNSDITLSVTDAISGLVAKAQQMISAFSKVTSFPDNDVSPISQETGVGENTDENGVPIAGAVVGVGIAAGAAYIYRKPIVKELSPYVRSLTESGNFITGVKYYVDEIKVVARNTINELISYTPGTSVTERVVARGNVVKDQKVIKDYPVSNATASYSPVVTASYGTAIAAQTAKQSDFWGGLWNGFTGAVSGLVNAVTSPMVNLWNNDIAPWVRNNSALLKNTSDTLGWVSAGLMTAGFIIIATTGWTGIGAGIGAAVAGIGFGVGAISGGMDIAIAKARIDGGEADTDDYVRLAMAPLAFLPYGGAGKQAAKAVGKEVAERLVRQYGDDAVKMGLKAVKQEGKEITEAELEAAAKKAAKEAAEEAVIASFKKAKPIVEVDKLGYLVDATKGKAKGFEMIGYTKDNINELEKLLLSQQKAIKGTEIIKSTEWGPRIEIVKEVVGPNGIKGKVTSVWQLEDGTMRLLTAIAEPFK